MPPFQGRPWAIALLAALVLVTAGCRTTAPSPASPDPLPPPPRPVPAPEPTPAPGPPAEPKSRPFQPVPQGVFESTSRFPETQVTEWQMSNGARLVFRPSRTSPRSVTLYAFAPGGFAAVPDSLSGAALAAAALEHQTGGRDAAVQSALREREAILLGTASTGALEELFEEVRRALDASGSTSPAFLSVQEGLGAALAGLPLAAGGSDPEAARDVYDRLFGDLRRYTLVLVGDATPEAVELAAARVLPRVRPSLQALLGGDDTPARPPRVPSRPERRVLPPGAVPAAAVVFRGTVEPSFDTLAGLDVLAAILQDELGEEEVHATAEVHSDAGVGEVRVVAEGVDPEDFEEELLDAVRALYAEPPSVRALAQARERRREAHEAALERGNGWLPWLVRLYRYDQDTREALRYARRLDGVTALEAHALARAVLDPTRFVLVVQPGH